MDSVPPPAPPSTPVTPVTPPTITTPPAANFFQDKKKLLMMAMGVIVALGIILGITILVKSMPKKVATPAASTEETSKTWELTVDYNSTTKNLTSKKVTLLDKTIRPDPRTTDSSTYNLYLLDQNNVILYKSKVNITEQLIIEPYQGASGSATPTPPSTLTSVIYVPQFPTGTSIKITNNSSLVLDLKLPEQKTSFNFNLIPEAKAQTTTSTGAKPIQIVFISDGYSDLNRFHSDVSAIENQMRITAPYDSVQSSIFDFQIIDNQQPLGCTQGIMRCTANNLQAIYQVGYGKFPSASKLVVVVNVTDQRAIDSLGVTIGIGGNIVAVFNAPADAYDANYPITATHEVLGHAIGELYDRYVSLQPGYAPLNPNIKSNCTDNPAGESWWKTAGATGAYKGCANPNLYAPFIPSCPSVSANFSSFGNPQTIMSSGNCTANGFDPVEQYWIKNNIIARYQQAVTPSPSSAPVIFSPPPASTAPANTNQTGSTTTNTNNGVSVTTDPITNITDTTATANGTVVSIPAGTIRIRNFQYYDTINDPSVCALNAQGQPTPNDFCKYTDIQIGSYGIGPYSKPITGLLPGHTYAIRAYAVNDNTAPGYDVSLTGWGNIGQWVNVTTLGQAHIGDGTQTNTGGTNSNGTSTTNSGSVVYTCKEVPASTNSNGQQITINTLVCSKQ